MFKISPCWVCAHWIRNDDVVFGRCEAYPDGVPGEFIRTEKVHNVPFPGDHGIIFEQDPNRTKFFDINKLGESINNGLSQEELDSVVAFLPVTPPIWRGKELTVHDMFENLSPKELDYVMSKYTGTMRR